jgi:flagellar basal-body rod modification protein FlgD
MAAFAGLLNQQMTAAQASTAKSVNAMAAPMDSSSDSGSSSSAATISSSDFLTLLVTEMQNQDPTADTDPNEYISQLVQVNSLEQLISINQNLTTALGAGGTPPASGSSLPSTLAGKTAASGLPTAAAPSSPSSQAANRAATQAATQAADRAAAHHAAPATAGTAAAIQQFVKSSSTLRAPGNLSIPQSKASARRVARALDGQSGSPTPPVRIPGLK